jgi:lipopolysaccharide export system permease protein
VRIISKYVLREHLGPLVFAASALTSLMLLNYVAKQLPLLVGKGLPWDVIAEFLLLSLPFTIAMTLPMAVLVATLHAFSRLAADSEITAFKASGLALQRLMLPVVAAGLILSLILVWFNDQVMPAANWRLQTLVNDIARKKPTFALRPQVINEVLPMKIFLRAGRLESGSSDMRDVTIYDFSDLARRRTIVADSGQVQLSDDGRDLILSLQHGNMIELSRSEPHRLQRVFFRQNYVRVRGIGNDLERNTAGGERSDRERTICELQAQLKIAERRRDSVYRRLSQLDPNTVEELGDPSSSATLGTGYCAFLRALRPTEAQAALQQTATAQAAAPQAAAPQAAAPQAATPQARPADTIPKSSAGMDSIGLRRPLAPSLGLNAPETDDPTTPKSVVLEGLKVQYQIEERTIWGNQVEIEKKFAIAIACVIFALLGAPVAFRFPRSGVGMTIGVSLVVFGLYYCGLVVGEELARRGMLPAWITMWGTNAVLLAIGIVLTARLGTEGTTHRGSDVPERWSQLVDRFRKRPA